MRKVAIDCHGKTLRNNEVISLMRRAAILNGILLRYYMIATCSLCFVTLNRQPAMPRRDHKVLAPNETSTPTRMKVVHTQIYAAQRAGARERERKRERDILYNNGRKKLTKTSSLR